jgi:hypothetical protein
MKYVYLEYGEAGTMILNRIKRVLDPENVLRGLKL